MGTIDPKLNNYTWGNLTSLKSTFAEKTYKILSRFKGKKDRESFNDTLEIVVEVDSGLLKKLEDKFETIDKMTMEEIAEVLEVSAYESFVDKKKYIDKALKFVNSTKKKDGVYATLSDNLATIYYLMAKYDKALSLYKESLSIREMILGEEHLNTASSYNNLAELYQAQANYEQALPLYQKALAIREKNLGIEHLDTASSYNNLAELYQAQANYEQALPLYQKALTIREKSLGVEHLDTASSYNNLAKLYQSQANYEKALFLCQKALTIRENSLGTEHPDIASSYNDLAILYQSLGDYEEALELFQKALEIREKSLGTEHPDTVTSYNNLALFYQLQNNYEKALPLFKKVLAINEKILGAEHLETATSYKNLATVYELQDDYDDALQLFKKALAINEEILGAEHLETATSYKNLAALYESKDKYKQALPLYQKALSIKEKILGVDHLETATSYNSLAGLYKSQDDYEQALLLYQKALSIKEKILGEENPDPDTVAIYNNLAVLYRLQGDYEKALPLFKKVLAINEKILGTEHHDIAISYNDLAGLYESQGNYKKALMFYQKALAIREKISGVSDTITVAMHNNLNYFKQEQNKLFFLNSENSNLIFKIDKIKIENFKQYKNFSIPFSPHINIIVGQNAIGKTTLLQAITLGLLKENSPDEEKTYTKYIKKNEEKSTLTLSHNKRKKVVNVLKDKRKIKSNYFIPFVLSYGSSFFTKYDLSVEKIVGKILDETVNKDFSHSIFLDYIDEFWNPLTILRELVRSKHEKAKEKKKLLFNTINSFLELENYQLKKKDVTFYFIKEGDDTPLFLEDLSEGYRSNVLLITDMLVKILGVGWTPATIEGIILIDEFDKHLHPKWQSQLVAKLANTFPNIQFIMTTHNPMSILDREADEITIIKEINGEIVAERGKGTKMIDVSTVLLEYFGVKSTISESMQKKVNDFNRLKLKKKLTKKEEKELNDVEAFLGNTVASNFIYDRQYLKFLEYIQVHKDINFDQYEQINDQEMDDLLKDFGDFFND